VTASAREPKLRLNVALYLRALIAAVRRVPPEAYGCEGPHAQFGEDRILQSIFGSQEHGYCVEVGAYDGITGSATYLFERKGWECLVVEPVPELAEKIRQNRRCVVASCAVSAQEGEATFYVADHAEQLSTLELTPDKEEWIQSLGGTLRTITVPIRTLDSLLDEAGFPRIDFMTIDVEGHELDVLRGLELERHRPRVVIVEENVLRGTSDIVRHMAQHGYVNFRRTGVNEWFAHESDAELIHPEAVREFQLEKAMREAIDPVKEWIVQRLPAALRKKVIA
jgi:FkbM family methyltransferase